MAARIIALVAVVIATSLLASAPSTARAEETCSADICLEAIDVVGTVPQPMVFVIDRGRLEIRPLRGDDDFTREIVESLRHAPF
jgi:hypothetical protein